MSQKILMPALSPTMTEGTLANWLVKEGDKIESGDVIAEIETDKATMEVEAVDEGVIAKILIAGGSENVAVNQVIALLAEDGEDPAEVAKQGDISDAKPAPTTAPTPAVSEAEPSTNKSVSNTQPSPQPSAKQSPALKNDHAGRVFISPLAKRMAQDEGLDITKIQGSGPKGRIIKADIEAALSSGSAKAGARPAPSAEKTAPVAVQSSEEEFDLIPLNNMRKTIAKRLGEAKREIPHFYLSRDVNLDNLLKVRASLNKAAPMVDGKPAYKLSVNDLIIKASAVALRMVPDANASFGDDGIKIYKNAHISVAVATDNGLITPVIRTAQNKGLSQISSEIKELAAKARNGKLMPEDYQGGTFTISNLGMFGVEQFQAIINPPQACILAVGAGVQKPIIVDGEIKIATVMTATLSVDHRAVDGALGAKWLDAFKSVIEEPNMMLI